MIGIVYAVKYGEMLIGTSSVFVWFENKYNLEIGMTVELDISIDRLNELHLWQVNEGYDFSKVIA